MKIRDSNIKKYTPSEEARSLEFVSYVAAYPNLCAGTLVLKQGSKVWKFPPHALQSGGSAGFSNNYSEEHVRSGPWKIGDWPDKFPEDLKDKATDLANFYIRHGCCGGCL